MQNVSRREFDDALNSYHVPLSEFHVDEWKKRSPAMLRVRKVFFMIMCSVIVCYLFNICYLLC